MKKIALFFFSISIIVCNGQTTDTLIQAKSKINLSIINQFVKVISTNDCQNSICFNELKTILLLDVFDYFNLQYDTELQQQSFKKTNDYKIKLDSLKNVKSELMKKHFFVDLNRQEGFQIYDYNINKNGFEVNLGYTIEKKINYFEWDYEFKALSFTKSVSAFYTGVTNYDRILFIPMNQDKALELENRREFIKAVIIFKLKDIKSFQKELIPGYSETNYYATTDLLRVVFIDNETDKIYFDKNFSINKAQTK